MGLIIDIRIQKWKIGGCVYARWKKVSFQLEGT